MEHGGCVKGCTTHEGAPVKALVLSADRCALGVHSIIVLSTIRLVAAFVAPSASFLVVTLWLVGLVFALGTVWAGPVPGR